MFQEVEELFLSLFQSCPSSHYVPRGGRVAPSQGCPEQAEHTFRSPTTSNTMILDPIFNLKLKDILQLSNLSYIPLRIFFTSLED